MVAAGGIDGKYLPVLKTDFVFINSISLSLVNLQIRLNIMFFFYLKTFIRIRSWYNTGIR
jgi:hypothetical protein